MLNLLATKIDGLEIAYIAVGILLGIAIIAAFIAGDFTWYRDYRGIYCSNRDCNRILARKPHQQFVGTFGRRVCAQTSRSERNAGCTGKKMRYYTNHFIRKPL